MQKEILNFVLRRNMSNKIKNKKGILVNLISYHRDEMTMEERNSFERELQKDPFAKEASEGFSQIPVKEAEEDILLLQKKLAKKVSHKSRIVIYRIASVVAALMIVSGIYFFTGKKETVMTLSENIRFEIKTPDPILEPIPLPPPTISLSENKRTATPSASQQIIKEKDQPTEDKITRPKTKELKPTIPQEPQTEDIKSTEIEISKRKSEKVSVEYYAAKESMEMSRAAGAPANAMSMFIKDYIPPQPVVGRDSFDIYLDKYISNPEQEKTSKNFVDIRFKVRPDSTISNIKIISSPGKAWSREAIRLIKEGPIWQPAKKDGIFVTDTISISIEFK
jgi:Gram-negative bacterial TonB protein C-terminal